MLCCAFLLSLSLFPPPSPPFSLCLSVHRSSGVKYNRAWYAALALVTLVLFSVAVGAVVFMAIFYTHPEACLLNKIFLGVNGSLCLVISLLAISPCIQKREYLSCTAGVANGRFLGLPLRKFDKKKQI